MASIWIVSEDRLLPGSLAFQLEALGRITTGPPERSRFDAEPGPPDLIVLAPAAAPRAELAELERLLEFVRGIEAFRRAAPPVLYVEPDGGQPPAALMRSLVDDRPVRSVAPPIDPSDLLEMAADLLAAPSLPPSLRERARRDWVNERVGRYYAGLDLPALRHAIDPRNARRAVLLAGEPGTGCGLLARYVHGMAEPARERLVMIPARALRAGSVEQDVIERTARGRVTVYLEGLDTAEPGVQQELAHLLGQSGLLGVETIRWIGSSVRAGRLAPELRRLPWLEVPLPPLRARLDVANLARDAVAAWCEHTGRHVELDDAALEMLTHYTWPGNLAELEAVLDASLTRARGDRLHAGDLRIGTAGAGGEVGTAAAPATPPPSAEPREPMPGVRLETGEPVDLGEVEEVGVHRESPEPRPPASEPDIGEIVAPLSVEVREPLLAVRTYANLIEQRPDDADLRNELAALIEGDLGRVEESLRRLERFAGFGEPADDRVDLGSLVHAEIERRRGQMRERSLVLLEEVERGGPPARVDEEQLRFALGGLLDRALRMVPDGGDLYIGSLHRVEGADGGARHRVLIRFHSPEDVLVAPEGVPGPPMPLEVVLARSLITRMGGGFAVDASGEQDNVILIELPA
jgi:hypothetical protein